MRDPEASLEIGDTHVCRKLRKPMDGAHFLRGELAQKWVEQGKLVGFEVLDPLSVVSPKLPFVSQPGEWCDSQFFDAAELTLQLQREAVAAGFDLKDASAWNILFKGTDPIFCDLLSFQPLIQRKWWATGQFSRHFIVPLLLSRRRGLHCFQAFTAWRDGVQPKIARQLLGPGRFLTRYWPLVADGESRVREAETLPHLPSSIDMADFSKFREGLHTSLDWMLAGVRPPTVATGDDRGWAAYVEDRSHYLTSSLQDKRFTVATWIDQIAPSWVADFGCNTGEFSDIALERGAEVVAIDADHDAIDRLYRRRRHEPRLHPLIANFDDLSNGRGWAGTEQTGLPQRLAQKFDLVMMLALVHHLAIAAAIPLRAIAEFAAHCTRRWLIVELMEESDPQLRLLCAQRQRSPAEFSLSRQLAAFKDIGFTVESQVPLQSTSRTLMLMRLST